MRRKFLASLTVFLFLLPGVLDAETLWRDRNIYSSWGNISKGDVIVVRVLDLSKYRFRVKLKDSTSSNIESNPDVSLTNFLPKVSQNRDLEHSNSTGFDGDTRIQFSIAARVRKISPKGIVAISGSRRYSLNGTRTVLTISGNVDARMISAGSVTSDRVADFSISVKTRKEGLVIKKAKKKDEKNFNAQFTEEEKRKLIIDYIEKIVREMTR